MPTTEVNKAVRRLFSEVADGVAVSGAQHVRYGLSLMNRWAAEGGNPFADAKWDEAWKVSKVTQPEWEEIRSGLRDESQHWLKCLDAMPALHGTELSGIISSVAQIAYHIGASRQVARAARVPREGTFA